VRRIDYAAVIVVMLFAMVLRISGTATFGKLNAQHLPSTAPYDMLHIQTPLQPDEYLQVAIPVEMIIRQRLNPKFFEYPSGIIYLNYMVNQLTTLERTFDPIPRANANLRTLAPFSSFFFSRMYSVLAEIITVACAYSSTFTGDCLSTGAAHALHQT
jgi:hypothetical protein